MPHTPQDVTVSGGGNGEMPPAYEEQHHHQQQPVAIQQQQQHQPYAVHAQPTHYVQPATAAAPVQMYGQPTYIQQPHTMNAQYGQQQQPIYNIQNQPQSVYVAQPVTQQPPSISMGNPVGVPTCHNCGAVLHIRDEPVRVSVWAWICCVALCLFAFPLCICPFLCPCAYVQERSCSNCGAPVRRNIV